MQKITAESSTSALEIFHALKIRYLPKSLFFEKDKMLAATKVSILDHNLNLDRSQVISLFFNHHIHNPAPAIFSEKKRTKICVA